MKERDYQLRAIDAILAAFEEVDSTLTVMPTGCVSGDALIGVNRAGKGYSRPLAKEHAAAADPRRRTDVDTYVRAHLGDRIGLHRAVQIMNSGEKETLALQLANGRCLRATFDHEILTENGFKSLIDLCGKDRVICEAPAITGRRRKAKPYYRMVQGLLFHPHAGTAASKSRNGRKAEGRLYRVGVHRLVCEARMNGVSLEHLIEVCRNEPERAKLYNYLDPAVWAVHHKDGDHLNNAPENLEVLTHVEHHRLHGQTDKLANLGMGLVESSLVRAVDIHGIEPTYDIVCDDPHRNFVANGIVVHNCGKTVVFSHVIKRMSEKRVMVLAHREELIRQAASKIKLVTGDEPEIEMAGERADLHIFRRARVIVSSIQTQIAESAGKARMEKFNPAEFGLLVIDEAHHAVSPSYRKVIDYYRAGGCKVLGVTATPDRTDEEALGKVFQSVAFVYEINDAIHDGWLVPILQHYTPIESLDFSKVRTTAGDLNGADLAEVMESEKPLHGIADAVLKEAKWKRTLVFATSVAHADRLAEIFNRKRPDSARWVCGETAKDIRAQTLKDYTAGRFQFLVNVGVFTEGFDEPSIEMVAIARPTKSRSLYAQMIGRGTRPLPGIVDHLATADERRAAIARSRKPAVEVLDFEGNSGRHKLVSVADILGGNYEDDVVEEATARAKKEGRTVNIADELERAQADMARKREEDVRREQERRRHIVGTARYQKISVDPFEVLDITPARERGWDTQYQSTPKQVELLERFGIDAKALTRKQAGQLIGECFARRDKGQCTYKQAKTLKAHGLDPNVSFQEASRLITELAANGWKKRPAQPAEVTT